jgi:hypothetical protein
MNDRPSGSAMMAMARARFSFGSAADAAPEFGAILILRQAQDKDG